MTSEASRPSQKRKDEAMQQKLSVPLTPKKRKPRQAPAAPTPAEKRFREAERNYRETYGEPGTDLAQAVESAVPDIVLQEREGEAPGLTVAKTLLGQNLRHGAVAKRFTDKMINLTGEPLMIMHAAAVVEQRAAEAANGDLSAASAMLASQALTLDAMFTEFANRAAGQLGQNSDAVERYARLAMKAQSNARTTLEALAKLHQPREQTVRHININAGGQAVVADQFHHHQAGVLKNEMRDRAYGPTAEAIGSSAALPSPDSIGDSVPVPSGEH